MNTVGESTEVATSPAGLRLRRAAARTAIALGFAVGGWLAVAGSASADTAPSSPPAPAPLFVGAGSLPGSLGSPLTPVVAVVAAPVTSAAVPVVTGLVAPVTAGTVPVVTGLVAPVAAVAAPVAPRVEALVAPVLRTLSPVLAPVTSNVAPLADVLSPTPEPLTSSPALSLTMDGPSAVVQAPSAVVGSTPAQTAGGADAHPGPLTMSLASGTSANDSAALTAPVDGPTDGPVVPLTTAPASPAGAPGSGSGPGGSSATGGGQPLGVVTDPAALHLHTRSSLISSSDDLTLLAVASEPGFSPA